MGSDEDVAALKKKLPMPSINTLMAAASEIGKRCEAENIEFAECKAEDAHVEHCVREGRKIQNCVHKVLIDLYGKCPDQFMEFKSCLENEPLYRQRLYECRISRGKFDACVASNGGGSSVATASVNENSS